jgi:hypothetical protein
MASMRGKFGLLLKILTTWKVENEYGLQQKIWRQDCPSHKENVNYTTHTHTHMLITFLKKNWKSTFENSHIN